MREIKFREQTSKKEQFLNAVIKSGITMQLNKKKKNIVEKIRPVNSSIKQERTQQCSSAHPCPTVSYEVHGTASPPPYHDGDSTGSKMILWSMHAAQHQDTPP